MKIVIENLENWSGKGATVIANVKNRTFNYEGTTWELAETTEMGRGEKELFHGTFFVLSSKEYGGDMQTLTLEHLDPTFEEQVVAAVKWIAYYV